VESAQVIEMGQLDTPLEAGSLEPTPARGGELSSPGKRWYGSFPRLMPKTVCDPRRFSGPERPLIRICCGVGRTRQDEEGVLLLIGNFIAHTFCV